MQTKGVSKGQMKVKLLQNADELTLYNIELKKENTELKKKMKELILKKLI